jgi:hypothetical protein
MMMEEDMVEKNNGTGREEAIREGKQYKMAVAVMVPVAEAD